MRCFVSNLHFNSFAIVLLNIWGPDDNRLIRSKPRYRVNAGHLCCHAIESVQTLVNKTEMTLVDPIPDNSVDLEWPPGDVTRDVALNTRTAMLYRVCVNCCHKMFHIFGLCWKTNNFRAWRGYSYSELTNTMRWCEHLNFKLVFYSRENIQIYNTHVP